MASGVCIDYEGIRETLLDLGDELDRLGYDWFRDGVEGGGRVGRAVQSPRGKEEIMLIREFMLRAARRFKELYAQDPKNPHLVEAMKLLDQAWQDFKECLSVKAPG